MTLRALRLRERLFTTEKGGKGFRLPQAIGAAAVAAGGPVPAAGMTLAETQSTQRKFEESIVVIGPNRSDFLPF